MSRRPAPIVTTELSASPKNEASDEEIKPPHYTPMCQEEKYRMQLFTTYLLKENSQLRQKLYQAQENVQVSKQHLIFLVKKLIELGWTPNSSDNAYVSPLF